MTRVIFASLLILFALACTNQPAKETVPGPPASISSVKSSIAGNRYKGFKAGTRGPFKDDKEIQWLDPEPGNSIEKSVDDESKSLEMEFKNDTAVVVLYQGKQHNATYKIDELTGEDERAGIKIRISYEDDEFKFGDGQAMLVTYTYLVEGISAEALLLETPRSLNRRKVIVWMKKQ